MHHGYGIVFDDIAKNVVIFLVDKSSSCHANNCKNNFLVLGEGPIFGINRSFIWKEKEFSISFSKVSTKYFLSLPYNGNNSCLLLM